MSRGPTPEKIGELKCSLNAYQDTLRKYRMAKEYADTIPELERNLNDCSKEILKLLEEMDCKENGNWGYESRIISLLLALQNTIH